MTPTFERIYEEVAKIPAGKVMSYGQVAKLAGMTPGAARVVGWALKALPDANTIPWQRVVNREGYLTIINPRLDALEQRHRLELEGVRVKETEAGFRVDQTYFVISI